MIHRQPQSWDHSGVSNDPQWGREHFLGNSSLQGSNELPTSGLVSHVTSVTRLIPSKSQGQWKLEGKRRPLPESFAASTALPTSPLWPSRTLRGHFCILGHHLCGHLLTADLHTTQNPLTSDRQPLFVRCLHVPQNAPKPFPPRGTTMKRIP